jgi:hypothetical protein
VAGKQLSDAAFQDSFLAHALGDSDFLQRVAPSIEPEHFSNELAQRLLRVVKTFFDSHRSAPGGLILEVLNAWKTKGLIPEKLAGQLLVYADKLLGEELLHRKYLLERYDEFLRMRELTVMTQKLIGFGQKEQLDKAEELIYEYVRARQKSKVVSSRDGGFFDMDPGERTLRRIMGVKDELYTLIRPLDQYGITLGRGHVGLLVSQFTGAGKSIGLMHFSTRAMMQGKKVLHLVLGEMSRAEVEDRYDSHIAGLPERDLDVGDKLLKRLRNLFRFKGRLWVECLGPKTHTVKDLRDLVTEIENTHGFRPDLVVIDYMDNIKPERAAHDDIHQSGLEIAMDLKAWAQQENIYLWTATQGAKEAQDVVTVSTGKMGGSRGKGEQADLIITINRTPEEIQKGITRLHIGKRRHGAGGFTVTIRCNYERMQFYVGEEHFEGEPEPEPPKEPKKGKR